MRQSIDVPTRLPACALAIVLSLGVVSQAGAQDRYRVIQPENFRREPGPTGRLLAQVRAGSELVGGATEGEWVEMILEGWIWAPSITASTNGEFDYEVTARNGENLRAAPNGQILARLGAGFFLEVTERGQDWVRVRRRGWIWGRSLERIGVPAGAPSAASATAATPVSNGSGVPPVTDEYTVTANQTPIYRVPDGDSAGVLNETTPVRLLERRAGWVRVRVDAWVPENAVRPATADILVGVSGAEVRARPEEFEGKVVQWTVQFISLRTADDLRAELPAGRRYALVRGPVPEAGFAYIILTDDQAQRLAGVTPLAQLVVDARVVVSRSRYLGNTVLELLDYSIRNR